MDPISTIVGIGRITNALYDQVQYIHHNKAQCLRLSERISVVDSTIKTLMKSVDDKSVPDTYVKALLDLYCAVKEAEHLFNKLTDKNLLKKAKLTLFAQTTNYDITEIHRQIDQGLLQLNLGLNVQSVLEKEERKKDQREDMAQMLLASYEIVKIREATLDKRLLNESQRKEVEEKQVASLQYNVDKYISEKSQKKKSTKPHFDEELSVPFSDLIIETLIIETPFGKLYYGRLHEQPVAIRVLEGNLLASDFKGFIQEVRIMQNLRSDYILPIYAICQEPGRLCLVTKYMEQGSLKQVLHKVYNKELSLSPEQQHQLILEIAMGLYYLHQKEICHRNLRSEHVLIDTYGHARIAEFRLSQNKMLSSLHEDGGSGLEWMAPEIWANSQSFTPQADIYSFGMVLWEIMTCKIPYASWDRTTWIDRIQKGERETLPSEVPEFYRTIIINCWQARQEDRPSLLSIITDLKSYRVKTEMSHALTDSSSSFWKSEKSLEGCTTPAIVSPLLPLISTEDSEHFRRAAKVCFDKGELEAAEKCYNQSVLLGNIKSMNDLAILHLTRKKEPNKVLAYQLLSVAANSGYVPAMENLANQLERGDGIKANPSQAASWRERAKASKVTTAKATFRY